MKSSGTHSSFQFPLAEPFDTPEGTVCFVDDVSIPFSWFSVDETNKYLYIAERAGSGPYTYTVRRIEITTGNHGGSTLKAALQNALNANTPATISASYIVTHTLATNKIAIAAPTSSTFHILTEDELAIYDNALYTINKDLIQSANGVLRNREGGVATAAENFEYTDLYVSGSIDIMSHWNIYISSSLASFNTLGPRGQSDIIAKVPVNTSYGNTIHHSSSNSAHDYCDVGKRSISSISFSIRDAYSNLIDLQGGAWSLSLVFALKD
jgi:hypothetical protein